MQVASHINWRKPVLRLPPPRKGRGFCFPQHVSLGLGAIFLLLNPRASWCNLELILFEKNGKKMMYKCFLNYGDQVYAIQNWQARTSDFDVMVLDPLDTQNLGKYSNLSKQGLSEKQIYKKLFPIVKYKPKEKVLIDIDLLTKEQFIHLIGTRLNVSLPTLTYMSTEDLKTLFSALSTRLDSLRWVNHN